MFNLNSFVRDCLQMKPLEFSDKYFFKLPNDLKVEDVVDFIKKNNLLEKMVDNLNDDSKTGLGSIYLVRLDDGRYEYFEYDYKGKMYSEFFTNLEQGVRVKIKNIFLYLGHKSIPTG
jgi:hypothetical protein